MATNLYEVLGISRNATPEEIRRAYRRKALETHPDRLPQGASTAEKSASEELFRKVNNAYEVLCDPQSRATYDQHGVWPPPMPAPSGPYTNGHHDPFSAPFSRDPFTNSPFFHGPRMDPFGGFGSRAGPGVFTDPFVLFNSIFGNLHRAFEADPFFDEQFGRRGFGSSNHFGGGFFNGAGGFPSMLPSPFNLGGGMQGGRMQLSSNGGNGGRWVSESWTSSTINGVTHTKCVRRDSEGNEHVTYRFPDGTERRTINGVEQSTSQPPRALPPSAPPVPPATYPTPQTTTMPPPPYSEAVAQPPLRSRSTRHHGNYYDSSGDRRDDRDRYRHDYSSQEMERDRGREYETERDGYAYRDSGHGREPQSGSWKSWRP